MITVFGDLQKYLLVGCFRWPACGNGCQQFLFWILCSCWWWCCCSFCRCCWWCWWLRCRRCVQRHLIHLWRVDESQWHNDDDVFFYNNCGNDDAFQKCKDVQIYDNICMKCKHTRCCSRRDHRLGAGKCLKNPWWHFWKGFQVNINAKLVKWNNKTF